MLKYSLYNTSIIIYHMFAEQNNSIIVMDDFDNYSVDIDSECLHQDFDDVDLYGEKLIEDTDDNFGDNIQLN